MENPLDSLNKKTLKDVALRRVAIVLCSGSSVLQFFANAKLVPNRDPEIDEHETKLMLSSTLSDLLLPETLNEVLLLSMLPLCREISKWINFHEQFLRYSVTLQDISILEQLRWTRIGTIDYFSTAKALTHHPKLDLKQRYRLACLYCLSDYLRDPNLKVTLIYEVVSSARCYGDESRLRFEEPVIFGIWLDIIRNPSGTITQQLTQWQRRHSSIYQFAFEYAAVQGYKIATKYFFEKLTYEEKSESLQRTALEVAKKRTNDFGCYRLEYQKFSDVLFYLFTVMTNEQRLVVLRRHPCEILKCCLDWPRQDIFVHVAELEFPYLHAEDYCRLLYILCKNINWGYNYSNILHKFFLISPKHLRNYALSHYAYFVRVLLDNDAIETIKFIFRNLDVEEREKLILSNASLGLCRNLMMHDQWNFLELLFREARLTESGKANFTVRFVTADPLLNQGKVWEDQWQIFLALLNRIVENTTTECSKCDKAAEDPEENPTKKQKMF